MPNKHLEHPEDSIISGRRNALRAVRELIKTKTLSVKWDGAPAIVFGMTNGSFFVGTKSVFNKKRPKINRCPADIDKNHKGAVADILRLCYRHLPRANGIYQADWIGVGGGQIYQPNTIEYRFSEPVWCSDSGCCGNGIFHILHLEICNNTNTSNIKSSKKNIDCFD